MPGDCQLCKKSGATSCCGGCKSVFYCNRGCQVKDWRNHKTKCKRILNKNIEQNEEKLDIDNFTFTLPPFDNKLIRIEQIEEKGYGIIANTHIKKGTIICTETPMIVIPDISRANRIFIKKQYLSLTQTQRNIYKSLSRKTFINISQQHQIDETVKLLSILSNNQITMPERNSSGIFPLISRVNHCCLANVHWRWMDKFNEERLIAVSDISKDTEITANYTGDPIPLQQRKMKLKVSWNIDCHCKWCTDSKMIKIIDEYIRLDETVVLMGARQCEGYAMSKKLIKMVEKYFNSHPQPMHKHCYDAAQYALALHKWSEAAYYLEEAIKEERLAQGDDVDISIQEMAKINQLPSKFRNRFKKYDQNNKSKKKKKMETKQRNIEQNNNYNNDEKSTQKSQAKKRNKKRKKKKKNKY